MKNVIDGPQDARPMNQAAPIPPDAALAVTLPVGVWGFISAVLHTVPVPGVAHDQMTTFVSAFDRGIAAAMDGWQAARAAEAAPPAP